MTRLLCIFLLLLYGVSSVAEDNPCWMNPDTIPETRQVALLKTQLLPINLNTPEKDLKARISHKDFRFIAIGGYGILYPGLSNKELLCVNGYRFISGTSDALESEEHGTLVQAFTLYAQKYNAKLEGVLLGK